MVPFSYMIMRYAVADATKVGVVTGLVMVGSLMVFLATLGITLSTMVQNVLFAVLLLVVGVLLSGVLLQFMGLEWMSTTAVINNLPRTFRGETPAWDQVRVLIVFLSLSGLSVLASIWHFRYKDL
jgi:hypothetical protein